ncbi:hypothetical protein [Phaeodactylibacter sp.]|uniref:hypothetical protein n=1 Tax=Phaeodactylibacter sp. TaxID=1940289 RepID=UPI0025F3A79F|nr:hypothetical protein [Phaeodactylibacter sp.]MCI5092704.1 hypothetical protein [Phaeodactylibacter sp.]
MKRILFFITTTFLLIGCSQQVDIGTILENPEMKNDLYSSIVGDHELMTEFMDKMMSNEHAMMMMKGSNGMMDMMMKEVNMMQIMEDKPEMMQSMMTDMMKSEEMMTHMIQMMNKEGMMSEECMQSCVTMMADKDMSSMDMDQANDDHNDHNH